MSDVKAHTYENTQLPSLNELKILFHPSKFHSEPLTDHIKAAKCFLKIWSDQISYIEEMYFIALDVNREPLGYCQLFKGGMHSCNYDTKVILQKALLSKSWGFLIAHNHPTGKVQPTSQDIEFTTSMNEQCKLIGVKLIDHLIVSSNQCYSFARKTAFDV